MHGFWDVTARVFWKGGIHVYHCETYLRIILIDEEGSKIECLSFGEQCINYIQSLREGQIYDFTSVCFRPTDDIYLNHLGTLRSDYYVHLSQSTDVRSCQRCVNIKLCPPSFLEFGNICVRPHNTFTDVIGVVVYVSRGQEGLNFRRRPSRHVVLMDSRRYMLIVHVRDSALTRQVLQLLEAEDHNHVMATVHVRVDWLRDVLSTTPYSHIIFNPQVTYTREFQSIQDHPRPFRRLIREAAREYMARVLNVV